MAAPLHDLSLDEALNGSDDEEVVAPETREHVDRLLGRLARLRAARQRDVGDADVRIRQVREWLDARCAVHDNAAQHIEALLTHWHEMVLSLDDRAKTVSLPNGTLKSRAHAQAIKIDDPAVFIEWATTNAPTLLREVTRTEPDRAAVKDSLQVGVVGVVNPSTGEVVPGVRVEPAGRTFSVEVTAPEEVSA